MWTFWDSRGTKLIEITYRAGIRNGPCQMWYGAFAFPDAAGRRKVTADFADDREVGRRQSWWPNGSPRCESDLARGAVQAARCRTEDGSELPTTESMERARSDLEADATYLRALDEVVEEAVARTAASPTYRIAGGTDVLKNPHASSRTLLIRDDPQGRACMKDCEGGSNACAASCAGTDSPCLDHCSEQRQACMERCPGARWTSPWWHLGLFD